jgi:hypothetical protein
MKVKSFIVGFISIAISTILLGCVATAIEEGEREFLITIEDLAAQGVDVGTTTHTGANLVARRYINGMVEVEYGYDSAEDPQNRTEVVFFSEADFYRNVELAKKGFIDTIEAYKVGVSINLGDLDIIEIPGSFTKGEDNFSAILKSFGNQFGNIVVTRQGKLVYSFILVGPTIQYKQTLINLIEPKLELYKQQFN